MDKVNMSLDEIIKLENVDNIPLSSNGNDVIENGQHNGEVLPDDKTVEKGWRNRKELKVNRRYYRPRNFIPNWIGPYDQSGNWNFQNNPFIFRNQRNFGRRNMYFKPYQPYYRLTERALFEFNHRHQRNELHRSGSFSNLHFYNHPQMRNGFVRAGSVTSLKSGHSGRSNISNHSRRSNKSNRSFGSNFSHNSRRSNFSCNSNRSYHSFHSYGRRNQPTFSNNGGGNFQHKRFRFTLDWTIQKEIKKLQVEGHKITRNSPMTMKDYNVETLVPLVFSTQLKLNDRITSNNA